VAAGLLLILIIAIGTVFFSIAEDCTCSYKTSREDFNLQDCDATSYETCVATGGFQHDWVSAQFCCTRDAVTRTAFTEWLWGGMQYQLEHHLCRGPVLDAEA